MGAHKGVPKSQKFKDYMREIKSGVPRTPEERQAISEGKLKYKFTEEHLKNLCENNRPKFEKVCLYCGQPFIGYGSQKYCSRDHQQAMRKKRRQEKNGKN